MEEVKYLSTIEDIRAFSDPYRLSILKTLVRFRRPATVKQIADKMGEVPAKIHYHVKKLLKADILKLDHTEEINGIIAKFYLPTAKTFKVKDIDENEENINAMLSELEVLCSTFLDDNKNIFLEQLKNNDNRKNLEGSLSSEYIYLSDEEYKELIDWISEKYKNVKDKERDENRKEYLLFSSIICTEGREDIKNKRGARIEIS